MCSWRAGGVLALLLALSARGSGAQQRDPLAAARASVIIAKARADSLHAVEAADSARRAHLPAIRRYGGIDLRGDSTLIPPAFLTALDTAFARALAQTRLLAGVETDSLLSSVQTTMTADGGLSTIDGRANVLDFRSHGPFGMGNRYFPEDTRHIDIDELTGRIIDMIQVAGGQRLPASIRRWAGPQLAIHAMTQRDLTGAYVRLALAHQMVLRYVSGISPFPDLWSPCLRGMRAACRSALAIVPGNDTISAWYSIPMQREMVSFTYRERYTWRARRPLPDADLVHECLDEHLDPPCHTVVAKWFATGHMYGVMTEDPTSERSRRELLRRALVRGGPDAFRRLMTATSTDIATILETTAGAPLDSLIDAWRADVLAAQPPSPAPTSTDLTLGVVVGVLLIGVAVGRRP